MRKTKSISALLRLLGFIKAVVIGNFISCVFVELRTVMSYMVDATNDSDTLVQPAERVFIAITVSGPEAFCCPRVTVPSTVVPSSQCAPITRFVVGDCGRAVSAKSVVTQSKTAEKCFFKVGPLNRLVSR